jgi:hypothetical protein
MIALFKPIVILIISLSMSTLTLYDFTKTSDISDWYVINDGVMGGLSKGVMELSPDGHGVFRGDVRLENNGGFSSIRHSFEKKNISDYTHLVLRVKGDGKRYQFRLKSSRNEYYSYVSYFQTSNQWETLRIPLGEMYPVFRGNRLNLPLYTGTQLEEIGILIGNKKAETFRLEIDSIYLEAGK